MMHHCSSAAHAPVHGAQHHQQQKQPWFEEDALQCKIIIRSRLARTPWEKLCRAIVGNPVHMDVVLVKPHSHSGRFCFSAYVSQTFEMCLMDQSHIMDPAVINQSLDVTEAEYQRCMDYMLQLVDRKTKYDYADALVLMPMAPKGRSSAPKFASFMSPLLQDVDGDQMPRSVFCSQSVVLMLRECLNPQGIHGVLVERLKQLNSRLVSPKMVFDILQEHPFTEVISNAQLAKICAACQPTKQDAR